MILPDPGSPNLAFAEPASLERLQRTAEALTARGFTVLVADDAADAKRFVLAALPAGAEVHGALSETLQELGIGAEIDESGRYDSVRNKLKALDRATQGREMRKLAAAPDYVVGSAHAITDDGVLLVGSGSGSQLGPYAYAAGKVLLVVGYQKLVRDLEEGRRRILEYCLPREFARMKGIGQAGTVLAKTLTLERDFGRVTVILVRAVLGY